MRYDNKYDDKYQKGCLDKPERSVRIATDLDLEGGVEAHLETAGLRAVEDSLERVLEQRRVETVRHHQVPTGTNRSQAVMVETRNFQLSRTHVYQRASIFGTYVYE